MTNITAVNFLNVLCLHFRDVTTCTMEPRLTTTSGLMPLIARAKFESTNLSYFSFRIKTIIPELRPRWPRPLMVLNFLVSFAPHVEFNLFKLLQQHYCTCSIDSHEKLQCTDTFTVIRRFQGQIPQDNFSTWLARTIRLKLFWIFLPLVYILHILFSSSGFKTGVKFNVGGIKFQGPVAVKRLCHFPYGLAGGVIFCQNYRCMLHVSGCTYRGGGGGISRFQTGTPMNVLVALQFGMCQRGLGGGMYV